MQFITSPGAGIIYRIMETYYTIEEKYLQAVEELHYGETPKGLQLLNDIISNDALYSRAHFQLGKIYYYDLQDYQTAGYHFKICLDIEPSFPDVYYHYMHLLVFLNMEKQISAVKIKALTTPGVNIAAIYNLLALHAEKNKRWKEAVSLYEEAFLEVTNKTHKEEVEESIERVRAKIQHLKPYSYTISE
jgi:tetratricopeptide (TPR) repeat protein